MPNLLLPGWVIPTIIVAVVVLLIIIVIAVCAGTYNKVGGQAVLGRQFSFATPWLTGRHG